MAPYKTAPFSINWSRNLPPSPPECLLRAILWSIPRFLIKIGQSSINEFVGTILVIVPVRPSEALVRIQKSVMSTKGIAHDEYLRLWSCWSCYLSTPMLWLLPSDQFSMFFSCKNKSMVQISGKIEIVNISVTFFCNQFSWTSYLCILNSLFIVCVYIYIYI